MASPVTIVVGEMRKGKELTFHCLCWNMTRSLVVENVLIKHLACEKSSPLFSTNLPINGDSHLGESACCEVFSGLTTWRTAVGMSKLVKLLLVSISEKCDQRKPIFSIFLVTGSSKDTIISCFCEF